MKNQEILNEEEHDCELPAVVKAFTSIFKGETKQISYSSTYNLVYKLCKRGLAQQVLKELQIISSLSFQKFVKQIQQNKAKTLTAFDYIEWFKRVDELAQRISQILLYLQSNCINDQKRQFNSIKSILNSILFQELCKNKQILNKISQIIVLQRIKRQKDAAKLIQIINSLDYKQIFYSNYFCHVYQDKISQNLKNQFNKIYSKQDLKQFIAFACKSINEERQWVQQKFLRSKNKKYIQQSIKNIYENSLHEIKQRIYIQKQEQIFTTCVHQFLLLLNQKNEAKEINDFNEWYLKKIKIILQKINKQHNQQFLQTFIVQYLKVSDSLSKIKQFNIAYKSTFLFQNWINDDKLKLSKRLNVYFQNAILNAQPNDENIKNFSILFKFLKEKDYFQKQFRRICALRVIYDSGNSNTQFQNNAVTQMSRQCGSDWVQKIQLVQKAQLQTQSYRDLFLPNFTAVVFEQVSWPFDKLPKKYLISTQLMSLAKSFKQKYEQKFKGRIIQWHPFQGFANLIIKFKNCYQQLKADTALTTILLGIQSLKQKCTILQLQKLTNFNSQHIVQYVQMLSQQKIINIKNLKDLEQPISLCESFDTNSQSCIDFTKRYLKQEFIEKQGHEQLKAERKMMVQAYIVRIMKSKQEMSKQELYSQITPMIESRGFKFNQQFVNNTLIGLIDKRYIKDLQNGRFLYSSS